MNTIVSALLNLMSNPTTSGVLLAALIGSNVFMVSEKSELERSNAVIEQQMAVMAEQLQKMVDAQEKALAEEKAKVVYDKLHKSDAWRRSEKFFKARSKEFEELEWYGPRKY